MTYPLIEKRKIEKIPQMGDLVQIKVPSRIHMSLLNDARIGVGIPGGGAISIALDGLHTHVSIEVISEKNQTKGVSKQLVNHILDIFHNVIQHKPLHGFKINVLTHTNRHLGFGSSVATFLGILLALNILYNYPLSNREIRKLLGNSYLEYEKGKGLIPGHETGGGPACMLYGGLVVLTDNLEIIDRMYLPKAYKILCFIPSEIYQGDKYLGRDAISEKKVFMASKRFSDLIPATANKVFYELLPAIKNTDIRMIGDIVEDMNFMMGNIGTIRTRYSSSLFYLFEKIRQIGGQVTGISSTGPTVYVIGKERQLEAVKTLLRGDIQQFLGIYNISNGIIGIKNGSPIKCIRFPDLKRF